MLSISNDSILYLLKYLRFPLKLNTFRINFLLRFIGIINSLRQLIFLWKYIKFERLKFQTSFLLIMHINQSVDHKIIKKGFIKRITKKEKLVNNII